MVFDAVEIMKRIPHRFPILLVDRILEMDKENKTIKGYKNITMSEDVFNGHFPGHPIYPGVYIIEGMAQCLGVLIMDETRDVLPYFAAMEGIRFRKPVLPGDQLVYEVRIDKAKGSIVKGGGVAKVDGQVVAEVSFTCSMQKQ
ncbi:MAG: 3-hydroxyacyl-ACP dehydratase FabZ [Fusobacteriaceae bacterium]